MAHSLESGTSVPDGISDHLTFQADGAEKIVLPSNDFIADAAMTRDGNDLLLESPSGEIAVIEGYFSADPAPLLQSPAGAVLTPNLVNAFLNSPMEYAANNSANDESPVGAVEEVKGSATVTRADGTIETITIGTPIYQGDVVETDASGAVNIVFMDETSMAVSENARLSVDEYTFDPSTESGTTNFSVLRGLFVFTSGLIGRDDPDDVTIDTPVGSIGIRGTVIAGDINPGGESKITVLEGAIVVKNGFGDITLSEQFETVRLGGFEQQMENVGVVPANDIGTRFNSIGTVSPTLFTTIQDAAGEQSGNAPSPTQDNQEPATEQPVNNSAPSDQSSNSNADIITLGNTSGLSATNVLTGQTGTATNDTSTSQTSATGNDVVQTSPIPVKQVTPVIETPAHLPLNVSVQGGMITDVAQAGQIVGRLNTTGGTGHYTITFGNGETVSANGHFAVVQDSSGAKIILTQAGADLLASSLDVVQLGGFSLKTVDEDGRVIMRQMTVDVKDANASSTFNLDGTVSGVSLITDNIDNAFGYTISATGDTNGDGFDDFIIGNDSGTSTQNNIYTINGQSGRLPGSSDFVNLSGAVVNVDLVQTFATHTFNSTAGTTSFTIPAGTEVLEILVNGVATTAFTYDSSTGQIDFGIAPNATTMVVKFADISNNQLVSAGDFNDDGVIDYLMGQSNNYKGGTQSGNAFIIDGADPSQQINFNGTQAGSQIGYAVDGIGDFNNDGFADIIVGAPGINGDDGGAFLVKGRGIDGSNISTTTKIAGTPTESMFGSSVTGIGDYDGDGYADFAVGAPTNGVNDQGSVSIYKGSAAGTTTAVQVIMGDTPILGIGTEIDGIGDFNGDGKSDLLISGSSGYASVFFGGNTGTTSSDANISINIPTASGYTIHGGGGIGDFNGDGYDDFTLSLANASETKTYVIFGGNDFAGTIDFSYLKNPDNALELNYSGANNSNGLEISGIGDINDDGYDDFAIGVPDANGTNAGNGGVMVVYGRDTGDVAHRNNANADGQHLVGTSGADTMSDGGFNGVSLRGGAGADLFKVSNTNFLGIDGGGNATGTTDTIKAMSNLNFTNVDFEKISGIEKLQFGANNQTMTLTIENLFNIMKTSDTQSLKIDANGALSGLKLILSDGAAGDSVAGSSNTVSEIDSWLESHSGGTSNTGTANEGGTNYNTFTIGGYQLLIDSAITVDAQ